MGHGLMISLVLASAALLGLILFGGLRAAAWTGRGITPVGGWRAVSIAQGVAGLAAATTVRIDWTGPGRGAAVIAIAGFTWLAVLAVATDLKTRKIPWEAAHPVAALGLVCGGVEFTRQGLFAFAASFVGIVAAPWLARVLTRKGLGLSDVRLLWAATATLSWWVGQNWLLYGVVAACVLQLGVRAVAAPLGLGALVPIPTGPVGGAHRRSALDPQPAPAAAPGRRAAPGVLTVPAVDPQVRYRRELPFAPALVAGLLGAVAIAMATGYGACAMWSISAAACR